MSCWLVGQMESLRWLVGEVESSGLLMGEADFFLWLGNGEAIFLGLVFVLMFCFWGLDMECKLAMVNKDCLFCKFFSDGAGGNVTKLVRVGIKKELGMVVDPMFCMLV